MKKLIHFNVNGDEVEFLVDARESLLEVLRTRLHFTGTKEGCSVGECGACTVIVNGRNITSCLYLAVWADGKNVETIEGQTIDGRISALQQNFIDENAIQCGFCTPGFVMSAKALLSENPHPNREEIKKGISGNMCRCTGYQNIIRAIEKTAGALPENK